MDGAKIIFQLNEENKLKARDLLWQEAKELALHCNACPLYSTRTQVVWGDGDINSKLMFIGEGPGADEDVQGVPFVGRAGQLLTDILNAAGIDRKNVYIANIVKCRPPQNRTPLPIEMVHCDKHLQTQIMLIQPQIIVLLGSTPTRWILKTTQSISQIRGKWKEWHGCAVMPMFHPSYLLRNPINKEGAPKHLTWLDIQEVKRVWELVKNTGTLEGVKFE
ncbi:MAG: uracil-DNA glycosylase [Synergistaceae bacterium]|nr:uracil-DNA glycosylase [Synergistaceae bacterium]